MKFVDIVKIVVKAGDGGAGHVSFRREKHVPKGGPDGGTGGHGGSVIFITDSHLNTLLDFKYRRHFKAENGARGGKYNKTGKDGNDVEIRVPTGTVIKSIEDETVLLDMTESNKRYVFLKGGKAGHGNAEFTTPTNQTPRYAEPGLEGEEREIILELKSIADVGFVGFPNVGKSTLISAISAAKPKIADYPFTTLVPNIGIVSLSYQQSFAVADIPGLIEGASDGKGLGYQFLRHVERTRVLLFMIDSTSADPAQDYKTLCKELRQYNPALLKKEKIIVFSKIDCLDDDARKVLKKVKFYRNKEAVFFISAVTGEAIDEIKWEMWRKITLSRDKEEADLLAATEAAN